MWFPPAATLNRMIETRARDMASRLPATDRTEFLARQTGDRTALAKALGLEPLPPRTDLQIVYSGSFTGDGYTLERLHYRSRPNLLVTAHLYRPVESALGAVIVAPDWWPGGKASPPLQAFGIAASLLGFAVLVLDPPGTLQGETAGERSALGAADSLSDFTAPATGQYAWDLIRGLEVLSGAGIEGKVGLLGIGRGALAASAAHALEPGLHALVCACFGECWAESTRLPDVLALAPGLLEVGDLADLLSIRAPSPVLLLDPMSSSPGALKATADKLRDRFRFLAAEDVPQMEQFVGGVDFNRRMRESSYAFLERHLLGKPLAPYSAEPRPLTDGLENTDSANTFDVADEGLRVLTGQPETLTLSEYAAKAALEPYPTAYDAKARLAPWGKYAKLSEAPAAEVVMLADEPLPDVLHLPVDAIDLHALHAIGLSLPEFFAQVLHQILPGAPDRWEDVGVTGDPLSAMIASVKTLVSGGSERGGTKRVEATGPVASLTALHLGALRPEIELKIDHHWSGWRDLSDPKLLHPQSRYLSWPFAGKD
ncbi:MAG TPA: hypothetical protein VEX38_00395 [Fimbriimonadaceae bacterium]|nr:hypothetical protein [Fimbriimonadaceae bacterium]